MKWVNIIIALVREPNIYNVVNATNHRPYPGILDSITSGQALHVYTSAIHDECYEKKQHKNARMRWQDSRSTDFSLRRHQNFWLRTHISFSRLCCPSAQALLFSHSSMNTHDLPARSRFIHQFVVPCITKFGSMVDKLRVTLTTSLSGCTYNYWLTKHVAIFVEAFTAKRQSFLWLNSRWSDKERFCKEIRF